MTQQKLLIATRNKGKIAEIKLLLQDFSFDIVDLEQAGVPEDFQVEETELTMEGNAILKAKAYGQKTRLLTLADDAGLEVDALDGRPGIYSARYAPGTDSDRCSKVLEEMQNVPNTQRGAQLRAVIALYDPTSEKLYTCEGIYRGVITQEPKGSKGFGYDPIFFNTDLNKTNAEMSTEEKNSVSHRGIALQKAKSILQQSFCSK